MFKVVKKRRYHAITIGRQLPIVLSLNLSENGKLLIEKKFAEVYKDELNKPIPPLHAQSWDIVITTFLDIPLYYHFIPKD